MKPVVKSGYKRLVLILDILFLLSLAFHGTTIAMTNAMVVKNNPDVRIVEANPTAAIAYGYEKSPEPNTALYIQLFAKVMYYLCLGSLLALYLYYRWHVTNPLQAFRLCTLTCLWFLLMYFNFSNDFGFWLGWILFGNA